MSTHKNTLLGMVCVALGQLFFAATDTLIKILLNVYDMKIMQIAMIRYSVALCLAFIWWYFWQPQDTVHWYGDTPYVINIWTRAFFYVLMTICLAYSLSVLPLGDTLCIFDHAPLVVAFAAYCVLGEKLPNIFVFVCACLLASGGIILLSQPSFVTGESDDALNIDGLISVFLAVAAFSTACLLVRTAKNAHVLQLELVNCLQAVLLWIPFWSVLNLFVINNETMGTIFTLHWTFEAEAILMLIAVGVCGFCGILFSTLGYQYGEATKVAFLEYAEIPLLFVVQSFLFKDAPNVFEILGALMVTVGCLLPVCEQFYHYYQRDSMQYEQVEQGSDTEEEDAASHVDV